MTQSQINKYFELNILPTVKQIYESDGLKDIPARRMHYNDMLDNLQRDGLLTDRQVNNMVIPDKFLK